uniref:Uncharacterized protein n=1 Tax=Knipowitschia caucasica TaxID=637954 RepID=A0AAV2JH37_KNICA
MSSCSINHIWTAGDPWFVQCDKDWPVCLLMARRPWAVLLALGLFIVKLHPVTLINISEVVGRPRCLSLHWMKSERTFLIATSEIHQGALESQVQFRAQRQSAVTVATLL